MRKWKMKSSNALKGRNSPKKRIVKRKFVFPGSVIRMRREEVGLKSKELARRSGVNPITLSAIELGRIQSPSLKHLGSIANALGISMASLFTRAQDDPKKAFLLGNQKGEHLLSFPKKGVKVVCYTPMVYQLFVGKVILSGGKRIDQKVFPTTGMLYVQPILGKLNIDFDGSAYLIREGNYAFLDGSFPHAFSNPAASREASFLLVSTPSFIASPKTSR
jgi:DNA-binding XRE family transcriptional regulator